MIFLKYVGLVLGFMALFFPSIQDKKAKPLARIIAIIIASSILLIAGIEIYTENRKLNPKDMTFIISYYCRGINNENDIYKLCPKSFYATLLNPKGALKFEFNRIDNVEMQSARGFKPKYFVIYESKYLKPEDEHFSNQIIESESDIIGEKIILKFNNRRSIEKQVELEKNIEMEKIIDGFACTLYIKGKDYKGVLDSTYLKHYDNSSSYGFSFIIDK